jgi:hypothetical protein
MEGNMVLRIGAAMLIAWGVLNAAGGFVGAQQHPAAWVGPAFVIVGATIVGGGLAFWRRRKYALALSALGLVALSALALVSGAILRGAEAMRISHHAVRLGVSIVALSVAVAGKQRADRREAEIE